MSRLADLVEPKVAVQRITGDMLGALPSGRFIDALRPPIARKGELTTPVPVCVLVHHATDIVRIMPREHPVDNDLGNRHLAADGFPAGFEIDRIGKTSLVFGAGRSDETETFGGAHRPMVFTGGLALRRYGLVTRCLEWRLHFRRCDRGIRLLRLEHRRHRRRAAQPRGHEIYSCWRGPSWRYRAKLLV